MNVALWIFAFALTVQAAPAPSPELARFRQILKDVGSTSPAFLARSEQLLAVESRALTSKLSWSPLITADASKSLPGSDVETKLAEIKASVNLFRFGADASSSKIGDKQIEQARLQRDLARLTFEKTAAQLLFRWIALQHRLASQKDLFKLNERLVSVAQERFRRGQLPEQEVDKVRLDQKNSEVQIAQAEVELINVRDQLEAILPGSSGLQDWPWQHLVSLPTAGKSKPIEKRKEYQSLSLEVDLNDSQTWIATTAFLPSLDLGAVWQTNEIDPLGRGVQQTLLTLTIPLWDGGKAIGTRGSFLHQKLAAEHDLERFKREETQRLGSLEDRRRILQKVALEARESSRKARALSEQNVLRFQLGRSSVNDLSIDQQRLFQAESLAQDALQNYHETLLEACLAADEEPATCY